jgi:hypothetical protein
MLLAAKGAWHPLATLQAYRGAARYCHRHGRRRTRKIFLAQIIRMVLSFLMVLATLQPSSSVVGVCSLGGVSLRMTEDQLQLILSPYGEPLVVEDLEAGHATRITTHRSWKTGAGRMVSESLDDGRVVGLSAGPGVSFTLGDKNLLVGSSTAADLATLADLRTLTILLRCTRIHHGGPELRDAVLTLRCHDNVRAEIALELPRQSNEKCGRAFSFDAASRWRILGVYLYQGSN